MSLVSNCLARLVKEGRVSQKQADDALSLHEGVIGRLGRDLPPASAEAMAALETARIMAKAAQERKMSLAKQAIAANAALERQAAHPKGKVAGLMGQLTRDIYDKGGENVESKAEVIFGKLDGMFGPGNEALSSKLAGLRQDRETAEKVIRENFGEATGDQNAAAISKAWQAAADHAVTRAKAAGKVFSAAEDWRQPQFWQGGRVQKFGEATFTADMLREIESGALTVMDKRTGAPAAATDIGNVLKSAFEDITSGGGRGGNGAFSPEMRVFRFGEGKAGADAYLRLQGKYGAGNELYAVMRGHLRSAATDIALTEQLGPDYRATFRVMADQAKKDAVAGKAKTIPVLSSPYMAEKTFKALTGEANGVENEMVAGIFAGIRGWLSAVQLGGATLSAIPGDISTLLLAAKYNGIPGFSVVTRALADMVGDSPAKRAFASRLGIVAHASADTALTSGRFAGEWLDKRLAGKVANFVIRASGLQAWTDTAKRAWTMEFLGHVADRVGTAYGKLDEPFRGFLGRAGIDKAGWDTLRSAPVLDASGAKFFDVSGVQDRALGERLLGAIIDERRFGIVEPGAQERAILTPSAKRGTLSGELLRSGGMYRSFSVSMMTTHAMRMAMQEGWASKMQYGLQLALYATLAGAVAIEAKDIVAGKDPRPMNKPSFWGAAVLQGGGLGIFGDFFSTAFNRQGGGFAATLGGPVAGLADDVASTFVPSLRQAALDAGGEPTGKPISLGTAMARQVRKYIHPGPFYSKLAFDRLFADQVQSAVDPQYRQGFRRMEDQAKKNYGTQFWWRPGETSPSRGPDLGNALPR